MKKEYVGFSILGIALGLVLGFVIANWTESVSTASPAGDSRAPQASVNSSSQGQELPPGHPPIGGEQQASPPLPADHPPIAGAQPQPAPPLSPDQPSAPGDMPSLEPLPASSSEERAEQKYQNIQLLKGVPASRITAIMNHFKSALGVDCTYCHVQNQFEKDDKPAKQVAREMITLTRNNNRMMGGATRVTCFTCHQGKPRPPQN